MKEIKPLRGEVWWVQLDPVVGHEQAKKRPCLVVSNDIFNKGHSELVAILPMTSRYRKLSWLVKIESSSSDQLNNGSYILTHQLRVVSLKRFSSKRIGVVSQDTMLAVGSRLKVFLDLFPQEIKF